MGVGGGGNPRRADGEGANAVTFQPKGPFFCTFAPVTQAQPELCKLISACHSGGGRAPLLFIVLFSLCILLRVAGQPKWWALPILVLLLVGQNPNLSCLLSRSREAAGEAVQPGSHVLGCQTGPLALRKRVPGGRRATWVALLLWALFHQELPCPILLIAAGTARNQLIWGASGTVYLNKRRHWAEAGKPMHIE
ncbi:hypothetical protein E2320_005728 [Naja naja]|nr:hypothetical protein E2320_005728 [Naja naja]